MIDLFWFFILSMMALFFVAWAAEEETLQDMADRLSVDRKAKQARKRAKNPAPKRAARWCKL